MVMVIPVTTTEKAVNIILSNFEVSKMQMPNHEWIVKNGAAVAISTLLSAAILYLATPRMNASFVTATSEHIIKNIQKNKNVGKDGLAEILSGYGRARYWLDDSDIYFQLARARALLFNANRNTSSRDPQQLRKAIAELSIALSLSPANPVSWLQIGNISRTFEDTLVQAGKYYRMSFLTGPNEGHLIKFRLPIAFHLWPILDADTRTFVYKDIRRGFRSNWRMIMKFSDNIRARGIIRAALATDKKYLRYYESLLAKKKS